MIEIKDKKKCSGCTACLNSCPKKAIYMVEDEEGFLYPEINEKLCINCNVCEKVCPYLDNDRPEIDFEKTYVAINLNDEMREKSSSGGMFVAFAKNILDNNGIVYGAAFDKHWRIYHKSAENEEELMDLIGSKYMQSVLGNIFQEVEKKLKFGRMVLFVGTTCQINGLKKFLRKDYINLYCIDFICLGVPSPKIWTDYIDTFFSKYEIQSINFKEKSLGWHTFSLNINGNKKFFCKNGQKTYFYTGYFRHLYTRPSCSNCVYKKGNRYSDITISDCWGYNKIAPEMDDNKGMSSVVCHSAKGIKLFDSIKSQLKYKDAKLEDILVYNSGYNQSAKISDRRDDFWKDYNRLTKKKLFKKYCSSNKNNIFIRIYLKIKK